MGRRLRWRGLHGGCQAQGPGVAQQGLQTLAVCRRGGRVVQQHLDERHGAVGVVALRQQQGQLQQGLGVGRIEHEGALKQQLGLQPLLLLQRLHGLGEGGVGLLAGLRQVGCLLGLRTGYLGCGGCLVGLHRAV